MNFNISLLLKCDVFAGLFSDVVQAPAMLFGKPVNAQLAPVPQQSSGSPAFGLGTGSVFGRLGPSVNTGSMFGQSSADTHFGQSNSSAFGQSSTFNKSDPSEYLMEETSDTESDLVQPVFSTPKNVGLFGKPANAFPQPVFNQPAAGQSSSSIISLWDEEIDLDPIIDYSNPLDLTVEQNAAFNAAEFVVGEIPEVAPPRAMC